MTNISPDAAMAIPTGWRIFHNGLESLSGVLNWTAAVARYLLDFCVRGTPAIYFVIRFFVINQVPATLLTQTGLFSGREGEEVDQTHLTSRQLLAT